MTADAPRASGRPGALGPATANASGETAVRMARSKLSHMLSCADASGWPDGLFVQPISSTHSPQIPSHRVRCCGERYLPQPRICLLRKLRGELDHGHWRKDACAARCHLTHGRYHMSELALIPGQDVRPVAAHSAGKREQSVASEHTAPPGFQKPQEKQRTAEILPPSRPHTAGFAWPRSRLTTGPGLPARAGILKYGEARQAFHLASSP